MKHNKRQIISGLKALAAVMAMMFTVTSCGMMEDDQSDCPKQLRVNFKYDMNMKFADAFPNEVKTVTLYAFDKDGNLALQKQESVKDIENRGGYMSSTKSSLATTPSRCGLRARSGLPIHTYMAIPTTRTSAH